MGLKEEMRGMCVENRGDGRRSRPSASGLLDSAKSWVEVVVGDFTAAARERSVKDIQPAKSKADAGATVAARVAGPSGAEMKSVRELVQKNGPPLPTEMKTVRGLEQKNGPSENGSMPAEAILVSNRPLSGLQQTGQRGISGRRDGMPERQCQVSQGRKRGFAATRRSRD